MYVLRLCSFLQLWSSPKPQPFVALHVLIPTVKLSSPSNFIRWHVWYGQITISFLSRVLFPLLPVAARALLEGNQPIATSHSNGSAEYALNKAQFNVAARAGFGGHSIRQSATSSSWLCSSSRASSVRVGLWGVRWSYFKSLIWANEAVFAPVVFHLCRRWGFSWAES